MHPAWHQTYDPLGSAPVSTLAAALPLLVLLGLLASHRVRAHVAALAALGAALVVATVVFGMPVRLALLSTLLGALYGFFPIGWIVIHVIFLYSLTQQRGHFALLREGITGVTGDRRLQLLLVAFAFGAFFEGAAGFGTPVAITAALLLGLGFAPLEASALSLIANTAPVAFGALGTPVIALQGVTGLDLHALSAMIGHQLPVFSLIVPFWLVAAYAGWRGMLEVWPAIFVCAAGFAVPQYLMATLHGPWLVDVTAAACSLACTIAFLRLWKPRASAWNAAADGMPVGERGRAAAGPGADGGAHAVASEPPSAVIASAVIASAGHPRRLLAWMPWLALSVVVFAFGLPMVKAALNGLFAPQWHVPGLDKGILRVAPVVAVDVAEPAVLSLNVLSATGTAILLAALFSARLLGYSVRETAACYWNTLRLVRTSLLTISAMMAIGYLSRYAGLDSVLGLAFAHAGWWYPFFGTMLGWLGVALTGSDTSSNVLFGNLQAVTARQVGLDPVLMAAANSSGGVMGKMIDAQSIVVASTATRFAGEEGRILRYVFFHSVALAALVGAWVMAQAYLPR
ncbi:MAG: L-lactate permease [Gemmatimonadetes bacterium]|nr:L-lactate permease [Gemmatimonadota bacterium]